MNDAHRWRIFDADPARGVPIFGRICGIREIKNRNGRQHLFQPVFYASDGMQQIPYPKEWPAVLARRLGPPFQPAIVARCHTKSKRTQSRATIQAAAEKKQATKAWKAKAKETEKAAAKAERRRLKKEAKARAKAERNQARVEKKAAKRVKVAQLFEDSPRSEDSSDGSSLCSFIVPDSEPAASKKRSPVRKKASPVRKKRFVDDSETESEADSDPRAKETDIVASMRANARKALASTAAAAQAVCEKAPPEKDIPPARKATLLSFFGKIPAMRVPTPKLQSGAGGSSSPESTGRTIYYTGHQAVGRSPFFTPTEFLVLMGYTPSSCVRLAAAKHGARMQGEDGQWFLPVSQPSQSHSSLTVVGNAQALLAIARKRPSRTSAASAVVARPSCALLHPSTGGNTHDPPMSLKRKLVESFHPEVSRCLAQASHGRTLTPCVFPPRLTGRIKQRRRQLHRRTLGERPHVRE